MELTEWERKSHQNDCGHKRIQNTKKNYKMLMLILKFMKTICISTATVCMHIKKTASNEGK